MSLRFKYKNKTTNAIKYSNTINAQPVNGKLWVVGLDQIQYSVDNGTTYSAMYNDISFPVLQSVQFKVTKNPSSAPDWPSGFPEYTLPSGVTGTSETVSYSNHTPNKKDNNDTPYKIKFRCGSSTLTKQFYTINVGKLEYKAITSTTTGATSYVEYPKRDSNYGSGYYLWVPKVSGGTLSSRAVNSMEINAFWPKDPNQKPVWSNAVITDSTQPWKAETDHSTLTAGAKTVVSAECGNTKPVDILVVDLDELTVTDGSDSTNKKIAKPNNQTLYVVQGTDDKAEIEFSLKFLAPTAPNGVPACPSFKWSVLSWSGTFATSNNPSSLTTSWTESLDREFTIKTWMDGVTETDDTVRKVDVVVAKIETELEKKWNSTWGAVTNKTGTYATYSANAGKKWYVLWDCHENRIRPTILPASLATNVSVSWNAISTTTTTTTGTDLWQNITNTSGSFTDVIPTLTLNNGVTLKGKLKTDIAVTGVQKVEWISNTTASTQNLAIIKETGQQEMKSFNVARVESDAITDRKKVYPEKSKPSDTKPFNVAELKATLTQQIPGSMNATLYFYVTDNTNDRPGNSTDTVITGGTNNGSTTREPNATNLNAMYGSIVGRTYVTFTTPAHAGDDYIGVAHPESGLTVTVNSLPNNPKAQVGTTVLPDEYQSKLITVWRTLWVELDRMAAPTAQTAPTATNPNGFANSDKGIKWDTTVPSPEPSDFDLLSQPDYPDISLLETAMNTACVDVEEATEAILTGWGLTSRRETPFVHNLSSYNSSTFTRISNASRDIKKTANDNTFWSMHGIGSYESKADRDGDPNPPEDWVCGVNPAYNSMFLTFTETTRDISNHPGIRPIGELNRIATFHEVLHSFGFIDHGKPGYSVSADGEIMTNNWYDSSSTPSGKTLIDYLGLQKEQVKKIQSKSKPK